MDDAVFVACGLAWAGFLIHAEAAIEHAETAVLHSAFFALVASAQFLWGIVVYHRPSPRLLSAGAVVSLMIAAVWVVSRVSGLPIGPDPWTPEAVGLTGALATIGELGLALVVALHLRATSSGAPAPWLRHVVATAGFSLIVLSSLAVTFGSGHPH